VEPPPRRDRTHRPTRPSTTRRPQGVREAPGGHWTYSQPGTMPLWVDSLLAHESLAAVETVWSTRLFDSTRGFPGEGPTDLTPKPWFLEDASTQSLRDRKRRRDSLLAASAHTLPAALAAPPTDRRLSFETPSDRKSDPVPKGPTPVPQNPSCQVRDFATPREQRDFLTPLPSVPAGKSLRQAFIKHFGGLRGMDPASFDEVWKVAKNGYNRAHDAHFLRFRTDFLTHGDLPRFNPTGIQPGDLVGFLRREHERGAAHPLLKDASASVSTACAQASDGLAQLGSQASVVNYLKYIKQSEAPDRKERMITYPDVARLIQIAWAAGPNGNLSLDQLKRKLVILLMVDTAARPSDLWRLYRTTVGKYRQIEFVGESDVRIRYFWPKEVDPFSSRTNATNTWFSQWVMIRGTTPQSTNTVACLRDFLDRSGDPELFASEFIPQLAASVQPLFFARQVDGVFQKCSVDHISVIIKRAIAQARMAPMKPRHLRGASTSKIVLLSPDAMSVAMGLGRWTTPKTFLQHYNAPVELNDTTPYPEAIKLHGQQLLRWGWSPKPPEGVMVDEYDEAFTFWVNRSIPRLGRIRTFDNGKYTVAKHHVSHVDLMELIAKARTIG
jgi:hypothetical protein